MKFRTLLIGLVVLGIGFLAGRQSVLPSERVVDVYNMNNTGETRADFEPFWKTWNIINERYGGEIDPQEKVWGAIEGLAQSLGDPYTVFLPPKEASYFEELVTSTFGGVGMEIGKEDDLIVVIAPLKNTPAERAGVRAGDRIIEIDSTSTYNMSVHEAVGLIRGEPGTNVVLAMLREGDTEPREVTIVRDSIVVPALDTELRSDGVFIISLYSFDTQTVADFRNAMQTFYASGSNKLILDLRGNPGGFLDAAISVASHFVPEGGVIVREMNYGKGETEHRSRGYARTQRPLTTVILIDKGSASASEIVAGALREHGVGILVGETTFGKGSVQELITITPETSLKLTIAQWLTPEGVSISDGGIVPDVVVEVSEEDVLAGRDPQLEAALELVKQ